MGILIHSTSCLMGGHQQLPIECTVGGASEFLGASVGQGLSLLK